MNWINHLMVFILMVVMPLASVYDITRLKKEGFKYSKIKTYAKIFIWYSIVLCGFVFLSTFKFSFKNQVPLNFNTYGHIAFYLCMVYLIINQLLPPVLLLLSKKMRVLTRVAIGDRSFIYPSSSKEIVAYLLIQLVVASSEEFVYRSYLYQYFHTNPFGASAIVSFLIVLILFGISHFQQGMHGILDATILGFFLGYIFISTGSLIIPIIIHILYNYKIAYSVIVLNRFKTKDAESA